MSLKLRAIDCPQDAEDCTDPSHIHDPEGRTWAPEGREPERPEAVPRFESIAQRMP